LPGKFEVGPANVRDVSYIAGNLRACDRQEIFCQLPAGSSASDIGFICTRPGTSFIAYLDGKPVMVFGFDPITLAGNALNAWAFGTRDSRHVVRHVTGWVKDNLLREWLCNGITRIEARSLAQHRSAHRWLKAIGAVEEGPIGGLGRDGENFILFAWHRSRLKPTLRLLSRFMETRKHVYVEAENCQTETAADSTEAR
tara:strand:- start:169 stop:762 length:594 start_codon:yes stop_codon:yes gene_type:complete